MSEWWKYTISDFLLFSPRTYYRLIERYNEALWPAHLLTLGLGLIITWLLFRPAWQGRAISAVLAALWAWVAWAFLWRRYATINWAATYFAAAFAVEAGLLAGVGAVQGRLSFQPQRNLRGFIGTGLWALSLALYPLLAPVLGRGSTQAEVIGLMPDPTIIGTLGLLLVAKGGPLWLMLVVPLLWCLVSGATLWALGSPEAWVVLPAVILTLTAAILVNRAPDDRLGRGG